MTSGAEVFAFPVLESDGALVPSHHTTPLGRATEIVEKAHQEAKRIQAEAEAIGHEAGFTAGLAAARADSVEAVSALATAAQQLAQLGDAAVARLERQAVELALALADKILGASLDLDPELVLELVTGALRRLSERDHVVLEVNPADYALVRARADELAAELGGIQGIEVIAERRVGRGGCIARTAEGEIDARIDEQLGRARELLRDALAVREAQVQVLEATLDPAFSLLRSVDLHRRRGRVTNLIGLVIEATGLQADVGELCEISIGRTGTEVPAEVVGFRDGKTLLMPLGALDGIGPGKLVSACGHPLRIAVGDDLLGRVLDGLGRPIDGGPPLRAEAMRSTLATPPAPLQRTRISTRLSLGVRALDTLVPCGHGQRLGIFSGSGVGKSSLLGMIARSTSADVNVICLVGERGREVREFVERDLGPEGLKRSVVVVATSDEPAAVRVTAAFAATTIAEHFRDRGSDVLLMMDSVTRFAMAQREIGLAIGEPPAARGYTPSVLALLPRLLERAGTSDRGSITGLYTVLVEGDDLSEPVADAARSILDGHCVLSRELAHRNHYPAIDVLGSVSRLSGEIASREIRDAGARLRELLAVYREKEDLITVGAYQPGSNARVDAAIERVPEIERFLRQSLEARVTAEEADHALLELMGRPAAGATMMDIVQ